MRPKTQKLVITFHTTAAAMAMEKLCHEQGLPGRLIPVPRELTADCGMACARLQTPPRSCGLWRMHRLWSMRAGRNCWSEVTVCWIST